jgi:predicted DNA-binding transcriptional regulator YafY
VPERETAEDRLQRLLWLLPSAAREGGASLHALARELGVSPATLMNDITEATTRVFHHPPGTVDSFTILVEAAADNDATVQVHSGGEFQRPPRLTSREALAVALGLRAMAAEVVTDAKPELLGLARRIETELVTPDVREQPAPQTPRRRSADVSASEASDASMQDVDAVLAEAATELQRCRITYLKPSAPPATRTIEPYHLVHSSGLWYVLARDVTQEGYRYFRTDRITAIEIDETARFERPADFSISEHVSEDGRPFAAPLEEEVVVRYETPAAKYVAEEHGLACDRDGSVAVQHHIADRHWLIRHVLAYGGAATVVSPPDLRREVSEVATRLAARAVAPAS